MWSGIVFILYQACRSFHKFFKPEWFFEDLIRPTGFIHFLYCVKIIACEQHNSNIHIPFIVFQEPGNPKSVHAGQQGLCDYNIWRFLAGAGITFITVFCGNHKHIPLIKPFRKIFQYRFIILDDEYRLFGVVRHDCWWKK